ncbi:MAG: hypothetical protein EBT86_10420 [Actinobacteria bacterium]|nr:hypothetical protein [Actinomycetota bacterium]
MTKTFDDLPRHTLIHLKDGGVFLVYCKVIEYHGGKDIDCYLGVRYPDGIGGVDSVTSKCYTNQIDSIIGGF